MLLSVCKLEHSGMTHLHAAQAPGPIHHQQLLDQVSAWTEQTPLRYGKCQNQHRHQPHLHSHSVSIGKAFAGGRVGRLLASWAPTPNANLQPLTSGFCLLHARATDVCTIYTVRDEAQVSGHANRGTSTTHWVTGTLPTEPQALWLLGYKYSTQCSTTKYSNGRKLVQNLYWLKYKHSPHWTTSTQPILPINTLNYIQALCQLSHKPSIQGICLQPFSTYLSQHYFLLCNWQGGFAGPHLCSFTQVCLGRPSLQPQHTCWIKSQTPATLLCLYCG